MYFYLGLTAVVAVVTFLLVRSIRRGGRDEARHRHGQKVLEDVEKAKKIRDLLDRDAAYREWVRRRYTRS